MNASSSPNQDIFDVRKIRRLVELMKEHDLSEIDLQQGDVRIQLAACGHGGGRSLGDGRITPRRRRRSRPARSRIGGPQRERRCRESGCREPCTVIKSPMVGTFYAAPDPDSPPFVKVGDHVGPETTVCIVEAMKVFNQIPAEMSGQDRGARAGRERRSRSSSASRCSSVDTAWAVAERSMFKRILVANRGEIALRIIPRLPRAGHRDGGHLQRGRSRRRLPRTGRRSLSASARPRPPTAT